MPKKLEVLHRLKPGFTISHRTWDILPLRTFWTSVYRKRHGENRNETVKAIEELLRLVQPEHKQYFPGVIYGLDQLIITYESDTEIKLRLLRCKARLQNMLINLNPDQTMFLKKTKAITPLQPHIARTMQALVPDSILGSPYMGARVVAMA